jgi:hypothetical protein
VTELLALLAAHILARPVIALTIRLDVPVITQGQTPVFRVLLRNTSDHSIRILDAKRGGGLQRWYYEPLITRAGQRVEMQTAIDDPIAPSASDFVILRSGAKYTFHLSEFATSWDQLTPGIYDVRIRFFNYPSETLESNTVKLQIRAR